MKRFVILAIMQHPCQGRGLLTDWLTSVTKASQVAESVLISESAVYMEAASMLVKWFFSPTSMHHSMWTYYPRCRPSRQSLESSTPRGHSSPGQVVKIALLS